MWWLPLFNGDKAFCDGEVNSATTSSLLIYVNLMLKVAAQKFHFTIYKNLHLNTLAGHEHAQYFGFFQLAGTAKTLDPFAVHLSQNRGSRRFPEQAQRIAAPRALQAVQEQCP